MQAKRNKDSDDLVAASAAFIDRWRQHHSARTDVAVDEHTIIETTIN